MNNSLKLMLELVGIDAASGILKGAQGNVKDLTRQSSGLAISFAKSQQAYVSLLKSMSFKSWVDSGLKPFENAAGNLQEAMLEVKSNIMSGFDKGVEGARQLQASLDASAKTAEVIAANMRFSKTEVVRAENELLKAGIAQDMVTGNKSNGYKDGAAYATAGLAQLSKLDIASSVAPWLAKIGTAFSFNKASQYNDFADYAARVDAASPTHMEEIMYNAKQATGSAAQLGITAPELVSMMGYAANLGNEAGTAAGRFLDHATRLTPQSAKALDALGVHPFRKDEQGHNKFVGLREYSAQVANALKAVKDDDVRLKLAHKAFGIEGGRYANSLATSKQSFDDFLKQVETSSSLNDRLDVTMSGLNATTQMLTGSVETLKAQLGEPILGPLTKLNQALNTAAGNITSWFQDHPKMGGAAASAAAIVSGVSLGIATYFAGKSLLHGISGARSLFGASVDLAKNVAIGKALQSQAGVTPVFVTNMPASMPGGVTSPASAIPTAASAAAGGGLASVAGASGFVGGIALGGVAAAAIASLPVILAGGYMRDKLDSKEGLTQQIADRNARINEMAQLTRLEREGGNNGAVKRLEKQIADMTKNREGLEQKLIQVSVNVDGRVLAQTVNAVNDRDGRRH